MNPPLPEDLNKVVTARRNLALAYLRVLGDPDGANLSAEQKLVWADILGFCYAHRLVSEAQSDGEYAPNRALFNDGRRSVWLHLRGQVIQANQPEPKLPSVRRRPRPSAPNSPNS